MSRSIMVLGVGLVLLGPAGVALAQDAGSPTTKASAATAPDRPYSPYAAMTDPAGTDYPNRVYWGTRISTRRFRSTREPSARASVHSVQTRLTVHIHQELLL
jgi:hypothetical protein